MSCLVQRLFDEVDMVRNRWGLMRQTENPADVRRRERAE